MEIEKEKIAFFDFCGTLVPFQSAEAYVKYVIKHTSNPSVKFRNLVYRFLRMFNLIALLEHITNGNLSNKKMFIYQIKGMSQKKLDELAMTFVDEIIKPRLIPETLSIWKDLQAKGFRMVVISGGLNIYLKYVVEYLGANARDLFATTLAYKNGICTGKMDFDCMNKNKVKVLKENFVREDIESVAYSDSDTDLPLLEWVNNGYFVVPVPDSIKRSECIVWYGY